MDIAFFGSSLASSRGNETSVHYRAILRALAERGHRITSYEPDLSERDLPDPPWATVRVYPGDRWPAVRQALDQTAGCDLLVKASGVGVFDAELEAEVAARAGRTRVAFWDLDAPATLVRLEGSDPLRALIPAYDIVYAHGGGPEVVARYLGLGARRCVPLHDAHDPTTRHRAEPEERFRGDLGLLVDRLPEREARVESFFFAAARALPRQRFVLGGDGWEEKAVPPNVRVVGPVHTRDHDAFNCSVGAVLELSWDSLARFGHAPAARVFAAAGAAACIIADEGTGVQAFLAPGEEVLLARNGYDVVEQVATLDPDTATRIGARARRRVLAQHTHAQRALELEKALDRPAPTSNPAGQLQRPAPEASAPPAVAARPL